MTIPGVAGPRHPVPLYDALAQAFLIALLIRRGRTIPYDGFLFWWTLFYASVIRFAVDLLRSEWRTVGILTLGQIGALVLITLSAGVQLVRRRRGATAVEIEASTP